jgi:hypothetical protein
MAMTVRRSAVLEVAGSDLFQHLLKYRYDRLVEEGHPKLSRERAHSGRDKRENCAIHDEMIARLPLSMEICRDSFKCLKIGRPEG